MLRGEKFLKVRKYKIFRHCWHGKYIQTYAHAYIYIHTYICLHI